MEPDLEAGSPSTTTPHAPAAAAAWIRFETVIACILAAVMAIALALAVFSPHDTLLPTFSLEVTSSDGLDGGPAPPAIVNATFGLTLHGATRPRRGGRSLGICQERGTVAVSYAGAVLAWGRVPGFCVPVEGEEHVRMVAIGGDVRLSDELRGRMAAERRARAAELDVDMTLDRWRLLSCRVKLDEPSPQPSPCKVYYLR
ncbi:hypothetical protein ACP70R_011309 [Stipagrostis hirtigluma subsp. patula]